MARTTWPEGPLESELFGHVRGAFTGAVAARVGRFEAAHGGTIFLDEVGEITPHVQRRLLRVLQEHELEPVGSNKTRKMDIRVIAATNRDLAAMCESGQFRSDLYYRLAVLPVRVPPLRERASDVPLLVEHLCHRIAARQGRPPPRIAPTTLECLAAHPWPGNVRELENILEYAFVLCQDDLLDDRCLPPELRLCRGPAETGPRKRGADPQRIRDALQASRGHRETAARLLGVTRMTLWKWMRDLDIHWPDARTGPH